MTSQQLVGLIADGPIYAGLIAFVLYREMSRTNSGVNLAVGLVAGIWRGTTFRTWTEAGIVMNKGTVATLVAWGVLIAIRLPFALVGRVSKRPQGSVIGELLLALAVTFAAQNAVLWLRSSRLTAAVAGG